MDDTDNNRELAVSVPVPFEASVEYYTAKAISLNITSLSAQPLLLERVTLRFQPDGGNSNVYVDHPCGTRVEGNELAVVTLEVVPTVGYQENTNYFDVSVHYCSEDKGRLSTPKR